MSYLKLVTDGIAADLGAMADKVISAHHLLHNRTGPGSEFTGWLDLPAKWKESQIINIQNAAREIQANSKALVVIGIGGSYLGSRAAIDMLCHPFHNQLEDTTALFFAGHNLSGNYHKALLEQLEGIDFSVNVISKSGTTIEPAIAFRLIRELLQRKYGKEGARKRIYATTDVNKGALRQLADQEGYTTFVIPEDIGGRYSVLTPVGLLPMAVAGIDIAAVIEGTKTALAAYSNPDLEVNDCYRYAAIRNLLYTQGKTVELLAAYNPALRTLGEWWKQLFGESEGKDGKGIFPASVIFTTDLHSLGQYIQDGLRNMFETVVHIEKSPVELTLPEDSQNLDKLNYLAGKSMDYVNQQAFKGTLKAHVDGGVPNIALQLSKLDEESFGHLLYFFMKACAISGYMLGVNPFVQPGVEAYKKNMFRLLGKKG